MLPHCDSVLLSCIDWRLHPYLGAYVRNAYGTADLIAIPGAVKRLFGENSDQQLFADIQLSVDLHQSKTIVLTMHRDCGAYGGSSAFANDHEQEFAHHTKVLADAAQVIHKVFAQFMIVTLFLELDVRNGRWVCSPTELGRSGLLLDAAFSPHASAEVS